MQRYPKDSQPCSFFITGGGFSLLDVGKMPGASKVLADAYVAYHLLEEISILKTVLGEDVNKLTNGEVGFVSPWPTYWYAQAMLARHQDTIPDATICVVNASLTTNRWRKGNNEAFYAIANRPGNDKNGNIHMFKLHLNKLSLDEYNLIQNEHENKVKNLSDKYQLPLNPVFNRRIIEDKKVAQTAMHLLLPELINLELIQFDEKVYPIEINGNPKDPESFQIKM